MNLRVNIGQGFYQSDSVPFSNQRCVNLYPNVPQAPSVSDTSLFGTEGLKQIASVSTRVSEACRGAIEFQGQAFFVLGSSLYEVEKVTLATGGADYRTNFIGFVNGGLGRVSMAENGSQLLIINDEGRGYIYQPSASPVFGEIADAGFYANGTPQIAAYVDRYFLVTTDQKKVIISAVGDGTNWNAIDFVSAEADPDDVVSIFIHKNQPYLLGSKTTEQLQNIGGAGVPFRRVNGFVVPVGCTAPFSVVNVGEVVYWVGRGNNQKAAVWAFNGGSPQRISTTAIDNALNSLPNSCLCGIFSFSYSQHGQQFVHFTASNVTFVFNPQTGRWHERESQFTDNAGQRTTEPCRISAVVDTFNELIVGDRKDGRIGIIDEDVYTEYGEPILSYFTTQPLYMNSNSFTLPQIELVCETGVGNPDCLDPKVRLEISRDGAQFENPRTRQLGASGNRSIRPTWYKNGRVSALAVLKVSISDPVKRAIYAIDLKLKTTGGMT